MTSPAAALGPRTIGEAFVTIRPDTRGFEVEAQRQANADAAGRKVGKQFADGVKTGSAGAGTHLAKEVEKGTGRSIGALKLFAGAFTQNSAQALGPLQEVVDKFELIGSTAEKTKSKVGGALLGTGLAVTGIGAFLSTLQSREQGATQRLGAAISAANGGSIEDYKKQIDEAVKSGERFGFQAADTINAVQALTIGLHDPKKAFEELGLVQDVAAAKQIPLGQAANLIRQAYNGNTRVLKQFGIQVADITHPTKDLAGATKEAAKTADEATVATHKYNEKLAVYQEATKHTLAQQLALKDAYDKAQAAVDRNATAQAKLKGAQDEANTSVSTGEQVLKKIADVTKGQASASADTFTGKLKTLGAQVEDGAAKLGDKLGHEPIVIGPALAGVGAIIETGLVPKVGKGILAFLGLRDAQVAAGTQGAEGFAAGTPKVEAAAAAQTAALEAETGAAGRLIAALEGVSGAAVAAEGTAATAAASIRASFGAILGTVGAVTGGLYLGGKAVEQLIPANGSSDKSLADDLHKYAALHGTSATGSSAAALDKSFFHTGGHLGFGGVDQVDKAAAIDYLLKFGDGSKDEQDLLARLGFRTSGPSQNSSSEGRDARQAAVSTQLAQRTAAAAADAAKTAGSNAGKETLDEFLRAIGGGPVAAGGGGGGSRGGARGGIAHGLAQSILDGQQAAVDAAKKVIAAVHAELQTAKTKLAADTRAAFDFRKQIAAGLDKGTSIADALNGIPGGINTNGDRPGGPAGFDQVKKFFEDRLAKLKEFQRNLSDILHKGLDPRLVGDLATAGVAGGGAVAGALAGASKEQLAGINALDASISKVGDETGQRLAEVTFRQQLAADKANTDHLGKKLDQANASLKAIERANRIVKVDARTQGHTAQQSGHHVGRAVALALKGM